SLGHVKAGNKERFQPTLDIEAAADARAVEVVVAATRLGEDTPDEYFFAGGIVASIAFYEAIDRLCRHFNIPRATTYSHPPAEERWRSLETQLAQLFGKADVLRRGDTFLGWLLSDCLPAVTGLI